MNTMIEIAGLLLASAVKFVFVPGLSIAAGYSFWETIIISVSGGSAGVLFFYRFGKVVITNIQNFLNRNFRIKKAEKPAENTEKKGAIYKVISKFGLPGLALLTPVLFSIPIGCMIAARFFKNKKHTVWYFLASVIFWAFMLTSIVTGVVAAF